MCLAIPGKILETHREHEMLMAKVQFGGITKRICLEYVPEAEVGQYVLVHVGFALAIVDEEEAKKIFEMLEAIGGLDELDDPTESPPLYRKIEPSAAP
ncbi:MAG: HypC/HybG/HupF family hydrogenase formation chaperone [Chthoniobacterales bacterium]